MTTSPNVTPLGSKASEGMMYAAVINQYGSPDVLEYRMVERPPIKPDQLLIRVRASSVNPLDCKIRGGIFRFLPGLKFPMILGFDLAGEVVAIGDRVTHFKPGDAVYAFSNQPSGGAYAEYIAIPEAIAAPKPNNLSDLEAGVVPLTGSTAIQALRDLGRLEVGQRVLINGASGGVGTFAVQIAKALGAEVTAVCGARSAELLKSLGVDRVIDYQQEDFTQQQIQYDVIFDVIGSQSFSRCKSVLKPNGIYITTQPLPQNFLQAVLTSMLSAQKAKVIVVKPSAVDLKYLKEQIEIGKVKPIVDRTYPLAEIAEAHRYSEAGHAIGKIAIAT